MKRVLLATLFLIVSTFTQAEILFEPMLGFRIIGNTSHQAKSYDTSFLDISGRLAYVKGPYIIGFEQHLSTWSMTSPAGKKDEYAGPSLGVVGGYTMGVVRFTLEAIALSKMTLDSDESEISGSGYALGVNVGGANMVNAFLKYQYLNYDKKETADGRKSDLNELEEITPKLLIFGISIPFEFNI
jgi:hypothetical protein